MEKQLVLSALELHQSKFYQQLWRRTRLKSSFISNETPRSSYREINLRTRIEQNHFCQFILLVFFTDGVNLSLEKFVSYFYGDSISLESINGSGGFMQKESGTISRTKKWQKRWCRTTRWAASEFWSQMISTQHLISPAIIWTIPASLNSAKRGLLRKTLSTNLTSLFSQLASIYLLIIIFW